MNRESGSVSVILSAIFGLFFLASSIFAFWAFAGRQDYKNNVDKKISDASAVAVQKAETAKDAEFTEKEKSPVRTYVGPATYGSVSFDYPKTWSVYAEEESSGTVLNLYAFPGVIPGIKNDQTFALRIEITSLSYDNEVKKFDKDVKTGVVVASAYRPEKVPSVLGLRLDGQIDREVQGAMVLFPLRDRTVKVYSEIPEFVGDLDKIILPSLTFIP